MIHKDNDNTSGPYDNTRYFSDNVSSDKGFLYFARPAFFNVVVHSIMVFSDNYMASD